VDRVPAIGRTVAAPALSRGQYQAPTTGDTVLLTCGAFEGDDLLVTAPGGLAFRLSGMRWLSRDLQPGDVLPVRVLATHPTLELEILGPVSRARPGDADGLPGPIRAITDSAAMRLDQAEMRTIAWRLPDAAALASVWRTLAQERWQQSASGIDPWLTPVYALGGVRILLRPIEPDDEPRPARAARRRRSLAIRIDLTHPTLGRIVLDFTWTTAGVRLALAVKEPASVRTVKGRVPAISAALVQAGLRLASVSITQGNAAVARAHAAGHVLLPFHASEGLVPGLFRAAAEATTVLLQAPREGSPFSRANR
jgi:hypothetical protein